MSFEDAATHVQIRGPLPLDVAGTLLNAIGRVYPSTRVAPVDYGDALHLVIPRGDRPVDADLSEGLPVEVLRLDPSGLSLTTPREIAVMLATVMEDAFAENEPENYLEFTMEVRPTSGRGRRYAMAFARSREQTPAQLRETAERKLEEANARIADLEAQVAAVRALEWPADQRAAEDYQRGRRDAFDAAVQAMDDAAENVQEKP
ncbi:hypothetical protein V6N00_12525 [Tersicoccus sp. MR15.9]|uniref:hypothetical protein n=1 Tax=Tersicoccus mangrovi TaxID=3121635 RepID=UPI002FE67022